MSVKVKNLSIEHNLTPKQLIFCKEYLVDMNATRAVIEAGYSKKSAETQGSRMLRNVKVKAYIDEMTKNRTSKLDITADKVLEELAKIAFFDIRNIFDGSSLKDVNELDDNTAKAIGSIKSRVEKTDGENIAEVIEYKANDKLKALDLLGKHLGMFSDKEKPSDDKNNEVTEVVINRVGKRES